MSSSLYFIDGDAKQVKPTEERLNFSYSNARSILAVLGLPTDSDNFDNMPIKELIEACQRFFFSEIADLVDGGRDAGGPVDPTMAKLAAALGGNWIDCGMRPGYLGEKINLIYLEAVKAQEMGAWEFYFG